jgi:hypothetical protein
MVASLIYFCYIIGYTLISLCISLLLASPLLLLKREKLSFRAENNPDQPTKEFPQNCNVTQTEMYPDIPKYLLLCFLMDFMGFFIYQETRPTTKEILGWV